MKSVCYCRKPY